MNELSVAPPALRVRNVAIWRGERCLCHDLSFDLHTGEALHVQGPNGAGKTSLIRVLTGLGRCDEGEVLWQGKSLRHAGAAYRAALAYLGHSNGVKMSLSPRENLLAADALMDARASAEVDSVLAQMDLKACADLPCGLLSMGQRRRAALARLLLAHVTLWFLDEPLASLDAAGADLLMRMLKSHLAAGGLVVFATHQPLDVAPFPVTTLSLNAAA